MYCLYREDCLRLFSRSKWTIGDSAIMRGLIVLMSLLIAIHATTATIDEIKKIKESAKPLLQTLSDTAATKIHSITDTASMKLQNLHTKAAMTLKQLQENAKNNINEFVQSIDYDKLKQLDILGIVPKVHNKIEHKKKKINFLLKKVKAVKSPAHRNFLFELEGEYPWPVVKRRVEYIYE